MLFTGGKNGVRLTRKLTFIISNLLLSNGCLYAILAEEMKAVLDHCGVSHRIPTDSTLEILNHRTNVRYVGESRVEAETGDATWLLSDLRLDIVMQLLISFVHFVGHLVFSLL